jgi:hypothetical protein
MTQTNDPLEPWKEFMKGRWGVDLAIRKLRPGCYFMLYDRDFLEWWDPNNRPAPTWDEIIAQVEQDKQAALAAGTAVVQKEINGDPMSPDRIPPKPDGYRIEDHGIY